MKINEQWSIEQGNDCFVVVERRPGRNPKTGEATISENRTYYPSLKQCAGKIIKSETLDSLTSDDLEKAVRRVEGAAERLAAALEEGEPA